jgi:hypothetical protein
MPDRVRGARLVGAVAAGVLAGLLAAPAAFAQSDEVPEAPDQQPGPGAPDEQPAPEAPEEQPPGSWGASSFDEPFDEDGETLRRVPFDVSGTMRYQKTGPADFIEDVEVRVVDDAGDSFTPGEGCSLPEPVHFVGEGPEPGLTAEHAFLVEGITVPCNGRYLVQAEGSLEDPDAPPYTMERSFVLAALPESVTGLGVTLDGQDRAVTVTFQPLAEDDLAPDATGYVLERSGPSGDTFVDIDSIDLGDEPRFVDPLADAPGGDYTYRVRAVRAGVDGDVRSSIIHTESDTVTVEGDPAPSSSTPTTRRSTLGSRSASGGRLSIPPTSPRPRLTPPTTLDTGFEDTIDYGEPVGGDGDGTDELAGDEPVAGQSIVQDEAEGTDLAVPAAGALVMLGWAGHILYLNRLAKQL